MENVKIEKITAENVIINLIASYMSKKAIELNKDIEDISIYVDRHNEVIVTDYEGDEIERIGFAKKMDIQLITESPASSESELELQCTITEID